MSHHFFYEKNTINLPSAYFGKTLQANFLKFQDVGEWMSTDVSPVKYSDPDSERDKTKVIQIQC